MDNLSSLYRMFSLAPERTSFGTYVSPTRFIPIKSAEELRAEARDAAAAKVLAVFRELGIDGDSARPCAL